MEMHFEDNAFTADGVYYISFKREGDTFSCCVDGDPCNLTVDGTMCIFANETRIISGPWTNAVDAILYGIGVSDFAKQVQRDLAAMHPLARMAAMHAVIDAVKHHP